MGVDKRVFIQLIGKVWKCLRNIRLWRCLQGLFYETIIVDIIIITLLSLSL